MTIKLTEKEKTLIHLALDYEKKYAQLVDGLGDLFGATIDYYGAVDDGRLYEAIGLAQTGDAATDIVLGYVSGDIDIGGVYNAIEYVINEDKDSFREWCIANL